MATRKILRRLIYFRDVFSKNNTIISTYRRNPFIYMCIFSGSITLYSTFKCQLVPNIYAAQEFKHVKSVKFTARERRFIRFASVEYNNQLYMTPQDFLEAVVEAEPRPRMKRKVLTQKELEIFKKGTPLLEEGSTSMFRNLKHKGIISYTEYLFLLSILTKPQCVFQIAFNMFDTDGDKKVDKNEFLIIEKIFSNTWKIKRGLGDQIVQKLSSFQEYVDDNLELQRKQLVDTTLMIHFFGPEGRNTLDFESFKKFMLQLQTELIEMEFCEFSRGLPTISEVEFAKILLRYTYLDTDEYDMYLDRVLDRTKDNKGITFDEFHDFCEFLNYLDDLTIALSFYTLTLNDHSVSKQEFHRAVRVSTGINLSSHVIHTLFSIFGDEDGFLACKQFIGIMKDRVQRGFKSYTKNEGWEAFKTCIKYQISLPI